MTLALTCLNSSSASAILPWPISANNQSIVPRHETFHRNSRALSSLISASWAQLTFSPENVRSFLKDIVADQSWDLGKIVALKPVTSTVIYGSIALAGFLALSVILCVVSCSNCCTKRSDRVSGVSNQTFSIPSITGRENHDKNGSVPNRASPFSF